jgi:acetyl-CoA carboxylase biotin carboxyl carrier protein
MDAVERVRQLIAIMADHDLAELEVEEGDLRVKIRKNVPPEYLPPGFLPMRHPSAAGLGPQAALQAPGEAEARAAEQAKRDSLLEITAAMVGTFYRAPSAGAEPYVSIGSQVEEETVVCIIEAMKVMNEIKAEVKGTIVEILVQDAEPVEYGQVLFLVEPAP